MARKPDGLLMAPAGGDGDPTPVRPHRPSDGFAPAGGGNGHGGGRGGGPGDPLEVVFASKTFRKFIIWTWGPFLLAVISGISFGLAFYYSTQSHIDNTHIHADSAVFETKKEAKTERKKLRNEITQHVDVKLREVKVEQKESLQRATKKLHTQQQQHYRRMLHEIRKAQ